MKQFNKRFVSLLLVIILVLSLLPISALAAPAADLPENMVDSAILRALEYTGYDVQKQKDDGTLYQDGHYGASIPSDILSGMHYGIDTSGKETVADSSTPTGRAPNIARFMEKGLCCASFVTYYFSYIINVEGVDAQFIMDAVNDTGWHSQAVETWRKAMDQLVKEGAVEKIGTSQDNVDRSKLMPGDIVLFGNEEDADVHAAIYSGTYQGIDFCIHVGNDRGPEIMPIHWMNSYSNGDKSAPANTFYHIPVDVVQSAGRLKIYKTDDSGNPLAGACFVATSIEDPTLQYLIGPTAEDGYASLDGINFGQYTIRETVFPTGYQTVGQNEWTVTLDQNTPNGVVSIHAVNELIPGNCQIVKTSEDGVVEGLSFMIAGDGYEKTVTLDASGTALVEGLKPGAYTVAELSVDRYEPQAEQTVIIVTGQTATVTFDNVLKRGSLKVTKTAEDGLVEGVSFRLHGTSFCGAPVDLYATTDSDGVVVFEDVLIGSDYTLEEVDTAERYVLPQSQNVVINWNEVTECTVDNVLKKFRLEVLKADEMLCYGESGKSESVSLVMEDRESNSSEELSWPYGCSQGDATLAGAVYGLYQDDILLDTYTTDENGRFTTKYYPCGEGYYLQELTPSEGYLIDPWSYDIYAYPDSYTVELNTEYLEVYEQIILGQIEIAKHTDDGETQLETPESGAQFEVYLKSAGSYDAAEDWERDIMVIGEDGFAISKRLPYGTYVVTQLSGWEGRDYIAHFEITITEHEYVYRFIINNKKFASFIKVIKTDAITGKIIPCAGAAFQIFDPEGNLVTMQYTYPQVTVVDTFYTTADGTLITPEALPYGKGYSLVEVQATDGYVLDATPVYFDVTRDDATEENDITVIRVTKGNMPQLGTVTINKSGEVFATVTENDGIYRPVYEIAGLEGAVFELYAADDILTPDGTLRYAKDEKVDTITTDTDGKATSKELYLGNYYLKEIQAPYGMLLNSETVTFALTYAGQEVSVTSTAVTVTNGRQKLVLDLIKALEQDETFRLGMNGEINKVAFGLYAAEDLVAADGTMIPKDGLLEITQCSEDGKVTFMTDVPVGSKLYVKEHATDPAYVAAENTYPVEFVYAGQEDAGVVITLNNGEAIQNKLIRGCVEGLKLDEDGNAITGAEFGLFRADTEDFTMDNVILIATSDANGVFRFENLPAMKFIIKELSCPEQYVLSDETFEVQITEDAQVITIEAVNKLIIGSVTVTKTDKDTAETLSGAVFHVYADTDGDRIFGEHDVLYDILTETEQGVYLLEGLPYGGYFLYEDESPANYKGNAELHYFAITKDNVTVFIETTEGKGFENEAFKGSIQIVKKDADTADVLSNVEFGLFDLEGNEVARGKTDDAGVLVFEQVRFGQYEIMELTAKDGYQKIEEAIPVEITEDGQVVTVELTNEQIPDPPFSDIPQTGDNSKLVLWIVLAVLALVGIAVLLFVRRRNAVR